MQENQINIEKTYAYWLPYIRFFAYLIGIVITIYASYHAFSPFRKRLSIHPLSLNLDMYPDTPSDTLLSQLAVRVRIQPFNLVAMILFFCAVIHTFLANKITILSDKRRERNLALGKSIPDDFGVEILKFMGEVEVIFGLWVIPLMFLMTYFYDWSTSIAYLEKLRFTEPIFVVVIMVIASTRPILHLAEEILKFFAKLGGGKVKAWWWAILTIGPLSGSFITEPAAMTISAMLLSRQFYVLKPPLKLAYATLGLLFVNVSVGGVLTNFAAPPVLMVAHPWHWSSLHMLTIFGIKAILGITISNLIYFLIFRKDFTILEERYESQQATVKIDQKKHFKIPLWITAVHVLMMVSIIAHVHHPVVFVAIFLIFIGFHQATFPYQNLIELKTPLLVGYFLAGLVVHGNLQGWWIELVLGRTTKDALALISVILTSFNDNAAITFLATLIPNFDDAMKYAVMSGAVTGGGLTVIANAPNPTGYALLGKHFNQGISFTGLFLGALLPTVIIGASFYFLKSWIF